VSFHTASLCLEDRPEISRASPAFATKRWWIETIEVLGSGFVSGCTVEIGGAPATVLFVDPSGQRLSEWCRLDTVGAAAIQVTNPNHLSIAPGGLPLPRASDDLEHPAPTTPPSRVAPTCTSPARLVLRHAGHVRSGPARR
jgi:hypothetical protein